MNEKAIASVQGSPAVNGPSDLGTRRKDIIAHGTRDDAQLARLESQREAREERNPKQEAHQNANFFNTQQKTNWTQRAPQICQNIQLLLTRQRKAERAAEQAKATETTSPSPIAQPSVTPQ